jgi:hypothetical protein
MRQTEYKTKKEQLTEIADTLKFPVIFPDDVSLDKNHLEILRSDGVKLVFTWDYKTEIVDEQTIKVIPRVTQTVQRVSGL